MALWLSLSPLWKVQVENSLLDFSDETIEQALKPKPYEKRLEDRMFACEEADSFHDQSYIGVPPKTNG